MSTIVSSPAHSPSSNNNLSLFGDSLLADNILADEIDVYEPSFNCSPSTPKDKIRNLTVDPFFSQSEALDILDSFGSPCFHSLMTDSTAFSRDEIDTVLRATFEENYHYASSKTNESTDEKPILPRIFIQSIVHAVQENMTIPSLDNMMREMVFDNIANDVDHTFLEKLLILRIAFFARSEQRNQRYINNLRVKATKNLDLEQRIQNLMEVIHDKDVYLSSITGERTELMDQMQLLQEKNSRITEELASIKKCLATEQERYMDLLQDLELQKMNHMKEIQNFNTQMKYKDDQCHTAIVEKEALLKQKEKVEMRLKSVISDQKKREQHMATILSSRDRQWNGEQITALEADRDMYYQQVCLLQEELNGIHSKFEECLQEKDMVIQEMQNKLTKAQARIQESTNLLLSEVNIVPLQYSSEKLGTLQRLKQELEQLERENRVILAKLDDELDNLKTRMDAARNMSINRSLLFANSTLNESAVQSPHCPDKEQSGNEKKELQKDTHNMDLSNSFEELVTGKKHELSPYKSCSLQEPLREELYKSEVKLLNHSISDLTNELISKSECITKLQEELKLIKMATKMDSLDHVSSSNEHSGNNRYLMEKLKEEVTIYKEKALRFKKEVLKLRSRLEERVTTEPIGLDFHQELENLKKENKRLERIEQKYNAIVNKWKQRRDQRRRTNEQTDTSNSTDVSTSSTLTEANCNQSASTVLHNDPFIGKYEVTIVKKTPVEEKEAYEFNPASTIFVSPQRKTRVSKPQKQLFKVFSEEDPLHEPSAAHHSVEVPVKIKPQGNGKSVKDMATRTPLSDISKIHNLL